MLSAVKSFALVMFGFYCFNHILLLKYAYLQTSFLPYFIFVTH